MYICSSIMKRDFYINIFNDCLPCQMNIMVISIESEISMQSSSYVHFVVMPLGKSRIHIIFAFSYGLNNKRRVGSIAASLRRKTLNSNQLEILTMTATFQLSTFSFYDGYITIVRRTYGTM